MLEIHEAKKQCRYWDKKGNKEMLDKYKYKFKILEFVLDYSRML